MLGIVTGLAAEARIARRLGRVEAGGGTVDGALAAAERLVAAGAGRLLSFGLAGGLDPDLRPGDIVVPKGVLDGGAMLACAPLGEVVSGSVGSKPPTQTLMPVTISVAAVVVTADGKARLWRETGACAVDVESGAVARVARRHGLPFAVLRAICDPAQRTLPPAALVALDPGGTIDVIRLIGSLARQPSQIPSLVALARDAARARAALVRSVDEILRGRGLVA